MHLYGVQQVTTGEWLDYDFQSPHFPTIHALIAACYESEAAFVAAHGAPENWVKKDISMEEIQAIFAEKEE
jgi:hypothetical protein